MRPASPSPEEPTARPDRHPRRKRADPRILVAIAVGAMGGATARYELLVWLPPQPGGFPWATFWTNVSGSFVIGVVLVVLVERLPPNRYAQPFLATGFLGAYTTFSTFSVEADLLVKDGHVPVAAAYVAASLVVGLTLAWLGIQLARATTNRHVTRRSLAGRDRP